MGLHLAHALKGLVESSSELARFLLLIARDAAHASADPADGHGRQGKGHEGDAGKQPVLIEHQRNQPHHLHGGADRLKPVVDRTAQIIDVVGEAGRQRARRLPIEERQVGADELAEEAILQAGDHGLADVVEQRGLAEGGPAADREDHGDQAGDLIELGEVGMQEGRVDDGLQHFGHCGGAGGLDDHAKQRAGDPPALRAHMVANQPFGRPPAFAEGVVFGFRQDSRSVPFKSGGTIAQTGARQGRRRWENCRFRPARGHLKRAKILAPDCF